MESTAFMQDSFIVPVHHRVFHFLPGTFHKKIPPHMEQNKYCRLQKMWFLGSWQCHLHLCIFTFQIQSGLATKFTIIWWLLQNELTMLLQVSPSPSQPPPQQPWPLPRLGQHPHSPSCCLGSRTGLAGTQQSPKPHTGVLEQRQTV